MESMEKEKKSRLAIASKGMKPIKALADEAKGKLCLAFDFGEYATKIVVAKVSKGKIDIKDVLVVENDERFIKVDSANVQEWSAKLKKELNRHNINPARQLALCTIGSRYYISRQLEVPYAAGSDLHGLVAFEMAESLSLDLDSYYYQYKILSVSDKNGGKVCNVWVAAVQKVLCDAYYELFVSMGMKPLVMDLNINGMARLLSADRGLNGLAKDRVLATVDFGIHGTEINVFQKGAYVHGANVDIGDGPMVTAAKGVLGVQIADIHNGNKLIVKPQMVYDITRQTDSAQARYFVNAVEEWLTEVNNAIKRYNISYPMAQVSSILLYGGSPQQIWLKPYLEKYLGVKTVLVQNIDCVNIPSTLAQVDKTLPQCLNAISLLLID